MISIDSIIFVSFNLLFNPVSLHFTRLPVYQCLVRVKHQTTVRSFLSLSLFQESYSLFDKSLDFLTSFDFFFQFSQLILFSSNFIRFFIEHFFSYKPLVVIFSYHMGMDHFSYYSLVRRVYFKIYQLFKH